MQTGLYDLLLDDEFHPTLRCMQKMTVNEKLTSPDKVVSFLNEHFQLSYAAEEMVFLIATTIKMDTIAVFRIAQGTQTSACVSVSGILTRLLLSGAVCFFIVHNHPSGDVAISKEDNELYDQMLNLSGMLGVEMLDFIIVGRNSYYSRKGDYKMGIGA